MTEEDRAKADAAAGEKLDKILTCLDSLSSRMDAMEASDKARKDAEEAERKEREDKARKDAAKKDELPGDTKPEPVAADKRKDGEETEDEKKAREDKARRDAEEAEAEAKKREDAEKADRARMDSAIADRIKELEAKLPKPRSDADYAAMADAQAKADDVYQAFGDAAPRPLDGETVADYERRLASGLKRHSARWKDVDLYKQTDDVAQIAMKDIYADAAVAARRPPDMRAGELREVRRRNPITNSQIIEFVGPNTFISKMKRPAMPVRIEARKVA